MPRWMSGPLLAMTMVLAASPAPAGSGYSWPTHTPYSVSESRMSRALDCRREQGDKFIFGGAGALDGSGRKHPVLLVHGTGISRRQSWEWNYWKVLTERGWEVCWIALPKSALGDIQISSEFVAKAIELMHDATGEQIDVLGHSQGGLQPRWAIKWFPSARFVADYIGLASPNHGTSVANDVSQDEGCFKSCWQLRRNSKFIRALNRDTETPGPINYTNIYTASDELIQPPGTQDLSGANKKNILLQDLCPGRPVDHVGILADYVTWVLVKDALRHPGPADPRILTTEDCLEDTMPGADDPPAGAADVVDFTQGKITDHEPPLKDYAKP